LDPERKSRTNPSLWHDNCLDLVDNNVSMVHVLSALQDRERISGLSWTQMETFLALVEEGSMSRASRRLGIGRSTLSAHIKSLAEEFNQRLFLRIRGRLSFTTAGMEAYAQLRPLIIRAGYCLAHFHSDNAGLPKCVNATLPAGFPGALIDQAIGHAGTIIASRSATWLSPAYRNASSTDQDSLFVGFVGSRSATEVGGSSRKIRDRWVVVRGDPKPGWSKKAIPLSDLAGLTIAVPKLPDEQLAVLTVLAKITKARLDFSSLETHDLLAEASQKQHFCLVMPAGLLNPALALDQFACAMLEESDLDPAIVILGPNHEPLAAEIAADYAKLLDELPAQRPYGKAEERHERLSLKYCRSFIALYEEQSVRQAAQRLCIVQPALTVQLHGLEEMLKVPLFARSHRGLQPTANGEKLYSLLEPLLAQFGHAVRSLREPFGGSPRRLRLGLIPAVDAESEIAEIFAGALDRWSSKHPEVIVQVLDSFSPKLLKWLTSGRIDFALIDRIAEHPDMTVEPVAEDRMAVIVETSSGLLPPGPVTFADVGKIPLVLPSGRHGLRSLLSRYARKGGLDLTPRIEVDSMTAAISLVKMGRYATILPVGAIYKSRERRRLSIHEISDPRIARNICLVQMRNGSVDSVTQDFIAELRAAFSRAGEFRDEVAAIAVSGSGFAEVAGESVIRSRSIVSA
jgi:DNA-binding transcriptional LysR family regulator